jgi:hypothetical protein
MRKNIEIWSVNKYITITMTITTIMGVIVLPRLVPGCGTVCRNSFDSLTFRFIGLDVENVLVQVTGIAALCV